MNGRDLLNLPVLELEDIANQSQGVKPSGPYRLRPVSQGSGVGVPASESHMPESQDGIAGSAEGEDGCDEGTR